MTSYLLFKDPHNFKLILLLLFVPEGSQSDGNLNKKGYLDLDETFSERVTPYKYIGCSFFHVINILIGVLCLA